jgi:methylmalonyl-CoA/ethylmalonyl-CoA epimerase
MSTVLLAAQTSPALADRVQSGTLTLVSTEPVTSLPGLLAVDHVGLAVRDLESAIAFHTGVLGLVVVHREVNEEQGVAEAMLAPADGTAAGTGGGTGGGAQIQLLAPLGEASPLSRFLDRSGPGLQQLAFRVADVELAAAVLRRRGLRLLYNSARVGTRGSLINFVHPGDTGGVLIELVESTASDVDRLSATTNAETQVGPR